MEQREGVKQGEEVVVLEMPEEGKEEVMADMARKWKLRGMLKF